MVKEQRPIDANEALRMIENSRKDNPYFNGKTTPIWEKAHDCAISCVIACPTVGAVVLPCKVGTQIWLTKWRCSGMRWMKLIEPKPRTIHYFDITKYGVFAHFNDGYVNVTDFGKTVFLTEEEAKAALEKMDGGINNE